MERIRRAPRRFALRLAGLFGAATALYHGIVGRSLIDAIGLAPDDLHFVHGTFQIGTLGWFTMAALLFGAGGFASLRARSWVVCTAAVLYGIPALASFTLVGGPSIGSLGLGLAAVLGLLGRRPDAAPGASPALA